MQIFSKERDLNPRLLQRDFRPSISVELALVVTVMAEPLQRRVKVAPTLPIDLTLRRPTPTGTKAILGV